LKTPAEGLRTCEQPYRNTGVQNSLSTHRPSFPAANHNHTAISADIANSWPLRTCAIYIYTVYVLNNNNRPNNQVVTLTRDTNERVVLLGRLVADQFIVQFMCREKPVRQPSPTCRTAFLAQHLRPSGVFSCWPDGLELTP